MGSVPLFAGRRAPVIPRQGDCAGWWMSASAARIQARTQLYGLSSS